MKTLVTGATGLVGSWLCRALLERGDEVRALVRDPKRLPADLVGRVTAVKGDVTEPASLSPAMEGVELVFHAAGLPEQHLRDDSAFDRVNHQGTISVLDAAIAAKVRRVVYTSTMDVFSSPRGGVVTEDSPQHDPRPTAYERSKQKAQHAVSSYVDRLDVVWIYPSAIYGPGMPTMLTGTIAKLLKGALPMLPPGGMSLVYVEGLAKAHLAAADRGQRGRGYLLADAHVTPKQLAEVVASVAPGTKVPATAPGWLLMAIARLTAPLFARLGKEPLADPGQLIWLLADTHVDASRAQRELGFAPTSVEEGVRRTVQALRKA